MCWDGGCCALCALCFLVGVLCCKFWGEFMIIFQRQDPKQKIEKRVINESEKGIRGLSEMKDDKEMRGLGEMKEEEKQVEGKKVGEKEVKEEKEKREVKKEEKKREEEKEEKKEEKVKEKQKQKETERKEKNMVLIAVGSQSPIKIGSVQDAFATTESKVSGYDVPSGVSPQPVGRYETLQGAINRAKAAQNLCPEADITLAFENGMVLSAQSPSGWVDLAAIVIFTRQTPHSVIWSDSIDIPTEAVLASLPESILGEEGVKKLIDSEEVPLGIQAIQNWSKLKDPHSELTNGLRPRRKFLSDALSSWVHSNPIAPILSGPPIPPPSLSSKRRLVTQPKKSSNAFSLSSVLKNAAKGLKPTPQQRKKETILAEPEVKTDTTQSAGFLIVVGSKSPIKLGAVTDAFLSIQGTRVHGFDVPSGVPSQPVGRYQTLQGAINRANAALNLCPDAGIALAIENGMVLQKDSPSGWVDLAAIVMISATHGRFVIWSDSIDIPIDAVTDCLPNLEGHLVDVEGTPMGIEAIKTWSILKDPHSDLTQGLRPRRKFLFDAVKAWIESGVVDIAGLAASAKIQTITPLWKVQNSLRQLSDPSSKKFAVLIATGSFNPPHCGHLAMLESAKKKLEENQFIVIGGFLSPSHSAYVSAKMKGKKEKHHTFFPSRDVLCSALIETSEWLEVDRWEMLQPEWLPNQKLAMKRLQTLLDQSGLCEEKITVFFVCGADLCLDSQLVSENDPLVVVDRPGTTKSEAMEQLQVQCEKEENTYFTEFFSDLEISSTSVRKWLANQGFDKDFDSFVQPPVSQCLRFSYLYSGLRDLWGLHPPSSLSSSLSVSQANLMATPLTTALLSSSRVLLCGCGGGFDFIHSLPLYFYLTSQGKTVYLCNLAFSDVQNVPGRVLLTSSAPEFSFSLSKKEHPERKGLEERVLLKEIKATAPSTSFTEKYFPEGYTSQWFLAKHKMEVPIYAINHSAGPAAVRVSYSYLVDRFGIDSIFLVDGGSDSLMAGDEEKCGTLEEDWASMVGVSTLMKEGVKQRGLIVCGMGADRFHGVSDVASLRAVAELTASGGFWGSLSLLPSAPEVKEYFDAVQYVEEKMPKNQTIVGSFIRDSIQGHFGNESSSKRLSGLEQKQFIYPIMSILWAFDLRNVICRLGSVQKKRRREEKEELNERNGWGVGGRNGLSSAISLEKMTEAIEFFRAGCIIRSVENFPETGQF